MMGEVERTRRSAKNPTHLVAEMRITCRLQARNPKIAAASRFRDWWDEADELSAEEAEDFAPDIEAGRREMNQPPPDRWVS